MSKSWILKIFLFSLLILSGALTVSDYWPTFNNVERLFEAGSSERRILILKIHEWFAIALILYTFSSLTIKIINRKAPIKTAFFLALQLFCLLKIYQTPWYRVAYWDFNRSMLKESKSIEVNLENKISNMSWEILPVRQSNGDVKVYPSYAYFKNPYLGGVRDYLRWHYFYIPAAMLVLIAISLLPFFKRKSAV